MGRARRAPCTRLARGLAWTQRARQDDPAREEELSPDVVVVLVFGCGPDRLPPWTRTPIRPAIRPARRQGLRRWWPSSRASPPRAATAWPMAPCAERVMALRGLMDRLEGHWLGELAAVDARGAAGAEQGVQVGSTAAWLRHRLRMGAGTAAGLVRTARALYRGPLTGTGQALTDGAHLPGPRPGARPRHPRPPRPCRCRRRTGPAGGGPPVGPAAAAAGRRPSAAGRRPRRAPTTRPSGAISGGGCGWRRPGRAWSPSNGLLDPEAGQTLLAALEPLARPTRRRRRTQRRPAPGRCPGRAGPPHPGERGAAPDRRGPPPADRDGGPGQPPQPRMGWAGEAGGVGPLDPEACRRLACDGAVTRVLVTRQPRHGDHGSEDATTTAAAGMAAWRRGWGRRRGCSPRPLGVPPPSRWRWAGPAGW